MNIAFFTHYAGLYGANRSLFSLIIGLRKKGVNAIVFLAENGKFINMLNESKIENYMIPFPVTFSNTHNPSIENFNQRINKTLNYILPITKICKEKNIELLYSNSSIFDIGLVISKILNIPHTWHFREYGDLDYNIFPDFGKKVLQRLTLLSDGIIFISNALKSHFQNVNKNNKVIYNGVIDVKNIDTNLTNWINKRIKPVKNFVLVGQVIPQKGQDKAVLAMKKVVTKYPEIQLTIVGGNMLNWITQMVNSNNLEKNIKIIGEVSNPDKYYSEADVALMCSNYEAMGRVTLEALSFGIPVIGNNFGATPELIINGYNGLLFNGTHEDLYHKMIFCIENPHFTRKWGLNGINDVRKCYTNELYIDNIFQFIEYILRNYSPNQGMDDFMEMTDLNDFERRICESYYLLINKSKELIIKNL